MRNKVLLISILLYCLSGLSCQGETYKPMAPVEPVAIPASGILTLSEEQLLSLDWHSPNRAGVRVRGKRVVDGGGVEFDILFPDNEAGHRSLNYISSGEGGKGALVGANIQGFKTYALKVTLVSIDGQGDTDMLQMIEVGAVIGLTATGKHSNYEPFVLGFGEAEKSVLASTIIETNIIKHIGFHIHILNPQEWDASGCLVTLRIEPVEDGGEVPWRVIEDK
ncbi:MAG: hypothetical protein GY869_15055 [Planctomycetes bacterium]|nr:hypothetical protein [Planctomycetota bacterium]